MTFQPFSTKLEVRNVSHNDKYFNQKLVFHNLEDLLRDKGYKIVRAETRQDGRGTPPALRIRTGYSQHPNLNLDVRLGLVEHEDSGFKEKLVFHDLEENLRAQGLQIDSCSTRRNHQHTPLALRVTLGRLP